ncbi:hypothetical protein BYT27DRAFT_7181497, partial [Phlegmacium glaucopus]
ENSLDINHQRKPSCGQYMRNQLHPSLTTSTPMKRVPGPHMSDAALKIQEHQNTHISGREIRVKFRLVSMSFKFISLILWALPPLGLSRDNEPAAAHASFLLCLPVAFAALLA